MNIVPAHNRSEIETCADIWLQASLAAHDFVPSDFWRKHLGAMKEQYLPASEVYLSKEKVLFWALLLYTKGHWKPCLSARHVGEKALAPDCCGMRRTYMRN